MPNKNSLLKKGTQTSQNSHDDPDMPMTQARMGKMVPNFVAETTQGEIDFHKWLRNSWVYYFRIPRLLLQFVLLKWVPWQLNMRYVVQFFELWLQI